MVSKQDCIDVIGSAGGYLGASILRTVDMNFNFNFNFNMNMIRRL